MDFTNDLLQATASANELTTLLQQVKNAPTGITQWTSRDWCRLRTYEVMFGQVYQGSAAPDGNQNNIAKLQVVQREFSTLF